MPNQPKTQARHIRVPDDLWTQITALAAAEGVTASDVVREAVRQHVLLKTGGGIVQPVAGRQGRRARRNVTARP